jgi:hypothetical protein
LNALGHDGQPVTVEREPVLFHVESDADAAKIYGYLYAAGYAPRRVLDVGNLWLVQAATGRFGLVSTEAAVLSQLLAGARTVDELAERLEVSAATAKWWLFSLGAKTGADDPEAIVALVSEAQA